MSIRLSIERDCHIDLDDETITLGSDPSCTVPLPERDGLLPRHAAIRKIAGRWLVEVRSADSIRVGDGEPTRLHWLNRGDVIHLTDQGPTVTFEPDTTDSKPSFASRPSPLATPGFRPTLKTGSAPLESDTFQLSPPKSIPMPPISAAIELDGLKSTPKTKSTPSRSSPEVSVPKSREVPPVNASRIPATGTKPGRTAPSEPDIPATKPVPKALNASPWMNSQAATSKARRIQAQRRFWMQMSGLLGFVILALIVWKLGRPSSEVPRTIEQDVVSDNSDQKTDRTELSSKPDSASDTKRDTKPVPVVESQSDAVVETSEPAMPPDTASPSDPGPAVSKPAQPSAASVKAKPSATLLAVRGALFAVCAQHPAEKHCFRIGTAWAATPGQLITTGAVAMAVDELRKEGLKVIAVQPGLDRPVQITNARFHAAYRQAVERARTAREQLAGATSNGKTSEDENLAPHVELARAYADQARFDLGVLDIPATERLKKILPLQSRELPDVSTGTFTLVGFPFMPDLYRSESAVPTDEPSERICPIDGATRSESQLSLAMKFPDDVATSNWSGGAILNRNRQVIGVYSRTSEDRAGGRRHAITWLGRLAEFAPEFE